MNHIQDNQLLLREAKKRLRATPLITHEYIRVSLNDRTLLLKGQVENRYQKRLAERALSDLGGLKVNNNVHVNRSTRVPSETQARLSRLLSALEPAVHAKLDCQTVHLDGQVKSWQERMEVEKAVLAIPGISSVESSLIVINA